MTDKMKVTFYHPSSSDANMIVATFGVHIISLDLFLSKLKIVLKKDGDLYVAPPSEQYVCNQTGQKKWANLWWWGEKSGKYFQDQCRLAIEEHCREKGIENPWKDREPENAQN